MPPFVLSAFFQSLASLLSTTSSSPRVRRLLRAPFGRASRTSRAKTSRTSGSITLVRSFLLFPCTDCAWSPLGFSLSHTPLYAQTLTYVLASHPFSVSFPAIRGDPRHLRARPNLQGRIRSGRAHADLLRRELGAELSTFVSLSFLIALFLLVFKKTTFSLDYRASPVLGCSIRYISQPSSSTSSSSLVHTQAILLPFRTFTKPHLQLFILMPLSLFLGFINPEQRRTPERTSIG